jgi:hypothetical protein
MCSTRYAAERRPYQTIREDDGQLVPMLADAIHGLEWFIDPRHRAKRS